MDRATGRSKGTGFACFWKAADADQVLEEANRVKEVTGANGIVSYFIAPIARTIWLIRQSPDYRGKEPICASISAYDRPIRIFRSTIGVARSDVGRHSRGDQGGRRAEEGRRCEDEGEGR
jgi:RNA recognition motif-containing protein